MRQGGLSLQIALMLVQALECREPLVRQQSLWQLRAVCDVDVTAMAPHLSTVVPVLLELVSVRSAICNVLQRCPS